MNILLAVLSIFFAILAGIFYYIGYRKYSLYADSNNEQFYAQSIKYMKLALLFVIICLFVLFTGIIILNFFI